MLLPAFLIRDGKDWRLVSYEEDILSRVRWEDADIMPLFDLELSFEEKRDIEIRTGLDEELTGLLPKKPWSLSGDRELQIDYAYAAAHLLDTVPNPWVGYEFVERVFERLLTKWKGKEKVVANNLVFILKELHNRLEGERDRLAEEVFNRLLEEDKMRFMVVLHELGINRPPREIEIPKQVIKATRLDGNQFTLNLYDPVDRDTFSNSFEHEVASFLDEQSKLYFWYRNIPRRGYYVQGWQKSRIYADFIFTTQDAGGSQKDYRKVFVLETKGRHLKNENTDYKQSVFALCNEHAKRRTWNELVPAMRGKEITYEVVFQDEWQRRLIGLLAD
jgi:type III restriction enzyme